MRRELVDRVQGNAHAAKFQAGIFQGTEKFAALLKALTAAGLGVGGVADDIACAVFADAVYEGISVEEIVAEGTAQAPIAVNLLEERLACQGEV
jgi:hypothetical protein